MEDRQLRDNICKPPVTRKKSYRFPMFKGKTAGCVSDYCILRLKISCCINANER
jgi:hypothetical protein